MNSATTIAGWTLTALAALEKNGIDTGPVLAELDIDPLLLKEPDSRISLEVSSKLMGKAVELTGDESFGLQVARLARPTSWHALGYSMLASQSIRECFERLEKYGRIFSTVGYPLIHEDDNNYIAELQLYPVAESLVQNSQLEAVLASLVITCRHLYPQEFFLNKVTLPRHKPADTSNYEYMFKCPIEYDKARASLYIPLELVDTELPSANLTLARANDRICEEYIADMEETDITILIRQHVLKSLHKGEPQLNEIAIKLNQSTRSLQRKLSDKNTSFKLIVDNLRKELALDYLKQPQMSLGDISFRLGFSQLSNFSRSFKRWTGQVPSEYRKLHCLK
ncbi:AraC family transcriptional regulator [Sessilibacter corallicola]|uniref:AraC family transcriptional regulator n=1 Tax=Sessilibacter corallicola TaxID=2904075 RepID=UPI001E4F82F9|nr:AraC family transcriptional regulator [Sessilibacter corallicola]MCE2030166.1 AraC family transcriptional regulator [Sessilibacter corallicola]